LLAETPNLIRLPSLHFSVAILVASVRVHVFTACLVLGSLLVPWVSAATYTFTIAAPAYSVSGPTLTTVGGTCTNNVRDWSFSGSSQQPIFWGPVPVSIGTIDNLNGKTHWSAATCPLGSNSWNALR
jgi:hypothetical protein